MFSGQNAQQNHSKSVKISNKSSKNEKRFFIVFCRIVTEFTSYKEIISCVIIPLK
jgi:hypothetical protein